MAPAQNSRICFSLRTLFIVVTLTCLVLVPAVVTLHRSRYLRSHQHSAVDRVTKLGGLASRPGDPAKVTVVAFSNGAPPITDKDIEELIPLLKSLPELRKLEIQSDRITNESLVQISELHTIETLVLSGAPITDEAIPHLKQLSRIKTLVFQGEHLTDKSLATLAELRGLESLIVSSPAITNEGLQALTALPNTKQVESPGTKFLRSADSFSP